MAKEKVVVKNGQKEIDPKGEDKFQSRSYLRFQSKARWTHSSQWRVSSTWKVSAEGDSMAPMGGEFAPVDGELAPGQVQNGDGALRMPKNEIIKGVNYQYFSRKPDFTYAGLARRINMSNGELEQADDVFAPGAALKHVTWVNELIVYLAENNPEASIPVIADALDAEMTRLGGLNCDKAQLNQFIVSTLNLKTDGKQDVVAYIHKVVEDKAVYGQLIEYLCEKNEKNDISQKMIVYALKNNAFNPDKTLRDAHLNAAIKSLRLDTGGHENIVEYIRQNQTRFIPGEMHKPEALRVFSALIANLVSHNPEMSKTQLEYALHSSAFTEDGNIDKARLNHVIHLMNLETDNHEDYVSYIEQYIQSNDAQMEIDRYKPMGKVEKRATVLPAIGELARRDPSGKIVTKMHGSIESPNVEHKIIQNNLFIDNQVHQADVQQGSIGDCYFLAALLQVIRHNPSTIQNMMKIDGSTVTTTFYRQKTVKRGFLGVGKKRDWVAQDISVKFGTGMLKKTDKRTGMTQTALQSSGYRVAYDPKTAVWSADISNQGMMKISKENMYEAALWVACMEQAYMVYTREYGQYGKGKDERAKRDLVQGITGGNAELCMHLFFGDKIKAENRFDVSNDATTSVPQSDKDLLKSNKAVLKELLDYSHQQAGDDEYKFLTTSISKEKAATLFKQHAYYACKHLKKCIKDRKDSAELKAAEKILAKLTKYATSYYNVLNQADSMGFREGETGKKATELRIEIDKLSVQLKNNDAYNALSLPCFKMLEESIGIIVANVHSSDYERDKRSNLFIYSSHAYSIHSVNMVDSQGQKIQRNAEKFYASVDMDASKIVLQNPHGKNKAALNEEEKSLGDGSFEISLRSYLNHIGSLQVAKLRKD